MELTYYMEPDTIFWEDKQSLPKQIHFLQAKPHVADGSATVATQQHHVGFQEVQQRSQ